MYNREENVREINEALMAGHRALECLQDAEKCLSNAKDLGLWDMIGGGLLIGLLKHSRLDDASASIEEAKRLLLRFQRELKDVLIPADLKMEIDGFITFADFFPDGVIADWYVQKKIDQALEEVQDARVRVDSVLNELEDMKKGEMEHCGFGG